MAPPSLSSPRAGNDPTHGRFLLPVTPLELVHDATTDTSLPQTRCHYWSSFDSFPA